MSHLDPVIWMLLLALLFAPAWALLALPCWRGLLQTLRLVRPVDDAAREATARITAVLDELREAGQEVVSRAAAQVVQEGADWLARTWDRLFSADPEPPAAPVPEVPGLLDDAALLARQGLPVYGHWTDQLQPRLAAWEDLEPRARIHLVRDLMAWLERAEVAPVVRAAGRRLGLGPDVLGRKKSELRERGLEEAGTVAFGFWYALYCTVAFQLLVVEGLHAAGLRAALKPALWTFGAVNLLNLTLVLRESWPWLRLYAEERRAIHAIAQGFGIRRPILKAAALLFGQGTAALFLAAFMARTALFLDQDRVLPWIHTTVKGLLWAWPLALLRSCSG